MQHSIVTRQELSAEFLAGLTGEADANGHVSADGSDDGLDGTSVKDGSELAEEVDAVDEHRRVGAPSPCLQPCSKSIVAVRVIQPHKQCHGTTTSRGTVTY